MSVRSSKNKAVAHQNEIRDLIRNIFCPPFKPDDIVSRTMGNSGTDVIFSPEIQQAIPFNIECKRHEDRTWKGTYRKSLEQALAYEYPLLIRRKNRSSNHYFAYIQDILDIHPGFLRNEKLIGHDNMRTFMLSNKFSVSIHNEFIHFNDKKFIEVLSCLKKSYSQ